MKYEYLTINLVFWITYRHYLQEPTLADIERKIKHFLLKFSFWFGFLCLPKTTVFFVFIPHSMSFAEMPQTLPMSFASEYASQGDYAQLTCVATKGDFPLKFEWFLNNKPIGSPLTGISTVSAGRQTSLLIVQNVTSRHAGSYECRVSNAAGNSVSTALLTVKGKFYLCHHRFLSVN